MQLVAAAELIIAIFVMHKKPVSNSVTLILQQRHIILH